MIITSLAVRTDASLRTHSEKLTLAITTQQNYSKFIFKKQLINLKNARKWKGEIDKRYIDEDRNSEAEALLGEVRQSKGVMEGIGLNCGVIGRGGVVFPYGPG